MVVGVKADLSEEVTTTWTLLHTTLFLLGAILALLGLTRAVLLTGTCPIWDSLDLAQQL